MTGLLILLIGYLIGSIPTGYLAGRWLAGIDLRQIGSGSTGATNVLRTVGKIPALLVFLIDVGKGIAPIFIATLFLVSDWWKVAAGLTALIGHIWPVWLGWKGGKAVATGLGMILGLSWSVGLASLGIFLAVLSLSKTVSLSSVIAALSLPLLMVFSFHNNGFSLAYLFVCFLAMAMVVWRHRSNLKRIFAGTEPKLGQSR